MCEWQLLSLSDSLWPHALYSPWNFPGQNGEWVAVPFSRGSSQRRDRSQVSHISGTFFTSWTIREAHCIAFICVHSFIPQSEEWCPRGRTSMLTDAGTCEVFGNSVVHSGWRAGCEAGGEAGEVCRDHTWKGLCSAQERGLSEEGEWLEGFRKWLEVTSCMEGGEEQTVHRNLLRGFCENVDDR